VYDLLKGLTLNSVSLFQLLYNMTFPQTPDSTSSHLLLHTHTHTHTHTLVVRRDSSTGPMTDNERAARSLRQVLLKPGNGRCSDCAADSEFIA